MESLLFVVLSKKKRFQVRRAASISRALFLPVCTVNLVLPETEIGKAKISVGGKIRGKFFVEIVRNFQERKKISE